MIFETIELKKYFFSTENCDPFSFKDVFEYLYDFYQKIFYEMEYSEALSFSQSKFYKTSEELKEKWNYVLSNEILYQFDNTSVTIFKSDVYALKTGCVLGSLLMEGFCWYELFSFILSL